MKKRIFITLLFIAVILGTYSAFSQEDVTHVNDPGFLKTMRAPAVFNHDEHNENAGLDCGQCHHVYDENGVLVEGETSEDSTCSDCHGDDTMTLADKYHARCKGCHVEQESGPVMCAECHPK